MDGLIIIMTTHVPNHAISYSSHVALMNQGRVVATGSPEQVIIEKNLMEIYGIDVKIFEIVDSATGELTQILRAGKVMSANLLHLSLFAYFQNIRPRDSIPARLCPRSTQMSAWKNCGLSTKSRMLYKCPFPILAESQIQLSLGIHDNGPSPGYGFFQRFAR
jgi:hypothetical protein